MTNSGEAAVWGVGTSLFGRFADRRVESLAWDAVIEAIKDADVRPDQIDAIMVGSVFGPPGVATRIQRGMGIPAVPLLTIEAACASGTAAFHEAVTAVRSGRYGCVLVIGVEQLSNLFTGAIVPEATDPEGASSLPLPGVYGLQAARYMDQYGVTLEQLAGVAVKNKRNGADNPRAHLRGDPPDVRTVLESKRIVDPLTFLQCCPTTDGAAALVVGAPRGAGHRDVLVRGSALVSGMLWDHRSDRAWMFDAIGRAAEQAYAEAGVTAAELDVLEVHDAFTIGEIITIEALGLAGIGEGAALTESGHTARIGGQPVNPSGGLLSRGHPLGATGTAQVAEIVWQLRGEAEALQVATPRIGLVETMGGAAAGMDGNNCVVAVLSAD